MFLCGPTEIGITRKAINDEINKFINDKIIGNKINTFFYAVNFFLKNN